jgi:Tol biopolymer transport system component
VGISGRGLARAAWLAAGGLAALALLLVAVGDPRQRSDVYAWLPDGRVFRVSPDEGTYYQACVSPDGTNVVFGGAVTGPPRIWRAELPSGEVRPLTPPDSAAFLASYSWDGSSIVFSSDRAFSAERPSIRVEDAPDPRLYRGATKHENYRSFNLFVMDADGGNVRQITTGRQRDLRGTFTPDGERVTFYSNRPPVGFYTVAADGSAEPVGLPLTGDVVRVVYRPWYTADGSWLYFFGEPFADAGRIRLMRVPARGGRPETLAWDDRGKTQAPFLDPNGGFLLFHTNRTGRSELYELALGGDEPRMLGPPGLDAPADAEIMHPTRARDGTLAFDLSTFEGPRAVQWLQHLRGRIVRAVRRRLGALGSG